MAVRLSFALATSFPGDIFVDEVIGAGDAFFMERARAADTGSRITVMASHSSGALRDFCNKGLWFEHGVVANYGPMKSRSATPTRRPASRMDPSRTSKRTQLTPAPSSKNFPPSDRALGLAEALG